MTSTGDPSKRKVKLTAVLSQTADADADVMDDTAVSVAYARYETVFGTGVRPPPDAEPTVEQLSGLAHLLTAGGSPYLDFAVWGPHGHRILRRLRLSGLQFGADGALRNVELNGPLDLDMWISCYRLLEAAFVMLDIVDLGPLQRYREMIVSYARRYGPTVWHLLYQADTRTRLEHMDRIYRRALSDPTKVIDEKSSLFDTRPWNRVWTLRRGRAMVANGTRGAGVAHPEQSDQRT